MLVIYLVLHFIILWPSAFSGSVTLEVGCIKETNVCLFACLCVYLMV